MPGIVQRLGGQGKTSPGRCVHLDISQLITQRYSIKIDRYQEMDEESQGSLPETAPRGVKCEKQVKAARQGGAGQDISDKSPGPRMACCSLIH